MWRGGGRIKGQGGRRRRRTARERRAKEMKLGNIGRGLEGENKAESGKRCRPLLLGGDRQERKSHAWKSISPWRSACVFSFMMQTQDRKR